MQAAHYFPYCIGTPRNACQYTSEINRLQPIAESKLTIAVERNVNCNLDFNSDLVECHRRTIFQRTTHRAAKASKSRVKSTKKRILGNHNTEDQGGEVIDSEHTSLHLRVGQHFIPGL